MKNAVDKYGLDLYLLVVEKFPQLKSLLKLGVVDIEKLQYVSIARFNENVLYFKSRNAKKKFVLFESEFEGKWVAVKRGKNALYVIDEVGEMPAQFAVVEQGDNDEFGITLYYIRRNLKRNELRWDWRGNEEGKEG